MVEGCLKPGSQAADSKSANGQLFGAAATATGLMGYGVPYANQSFCQVETTFVNPGTSPLTCQTDNRDGYMIIGGFWHRLFRGPEGTMQWGLMYEYAHREVWTGQFFTNTAGAAGTGAAAALGLSPATNAATATHPIGLNQGIQATVRYYLP